MIPDIESIKKYVEAAYNWPWWFAAVGFSIVCGYVLRKIKSFPNEAIPVVVVGIAAMFTMLMAPGAAQSFRAVQWRATNFAIGGILGLVAWQIHFQVLKRWFPWIDNFIDGNGTPPTPPAKTP